VAGCGECGDEPAGSCATELVSKAKNILKYPTEATENGGVPTFRYTWHKQ
jgi:hypothetical protein